MSEAWIGVIGALAGIVLTALATLGTTWLSQRTAKLQRREDRRDRRRAELQQIYTALLLAAQRFYGHVSTLDLSSLDALADEKEVRAQLTKLIDPAFSTALEESGTTAQLLSGEGLYDVLATFLTDLFEEAVAVAKTGSTQSGGYDELAKPLLRSMREELNSAEQ